MCADYAVEYTDFIIYIMKHVFLLVYFNEPSLSSFNFFTLLNVYQTKKT